MAKKIAGWVLSGLIVLALYLFLWPVPIDPVVWDPQPVPPLEGDFAENRVLQGMELFATPDTHGPEDVAVDAEGRIYVGVEEGRFSGTTQTARTPRSSRTPEVGLSGSTSTKMET